MLRHCFCMVLAISVLSVREGPTPCSGINVETPAPGSRAAESLKLLVVISRHGNRGLSLTYKGHSFPSNMTECWPYGEGQLTTKGRVQMYSLGKKMRSLYNGFLNHSYYSGEVSANSAAVDHAIMSGQSFLAGLYPPKGFQQWDEDIPWQPTALYSTSLEQNPQSMVHCPRLVTLIKEAGQYFWKKHSAGIARVNAYVSDRTNITVSGLHGLQDVWHTFFSLGAEGLSLPKWTRLVYPQPIKKLVGQLFKKFYATKEEIIRLLIGPFLGDVMNQMQYRVNGSSSRKLLYYSGQEQTLVALQAALGVPLDKVAGLVWPASALLLELHQDPSSKEFSIQALFLDANSKDTKPTVINVPGCNGVSCDFDSVVNYTQRFTSFTSYKQECQDS